MSDPFLTAGITVISGVSVFVLGQLISGLFVVRISLQARTIEEIAQKLVFFARDYSRSYEGAIQSESKKRLLDTQMELRRLAALLSSTAQTLKWYSLFESLHLVLPREQIQSAAKELMGLSNTLGGKDEDTRKAILHRKRICELLQLQVHDDPSLGI